MNRWHNKQAVAWYKARGLAPAPAAAGDDIFRAYVDAHARAPVIDLADLCRAIGSVGRVILQAIGRLCDALAECARSFMAALEHVDWQGLVEAAAFNRWAIRQGYDREDIAAGLDALRNLTPDARAALAGP